jgi:hypothetical protein
VKFYQNEITNIESKYICLFHSVTNDKDEFNAAKELMRTDRNSPNNHNDLTSSILKEDDNNYLKMEYLLLKFFKYPKSDN